MEEKIVEENGGAIIRNVFYAIKRNIILILVIMFVFAVGGVGYASILKPNYTASVKVRYIVDDNTGSTVEDINAMRAYIDTVVDFVDEGVVVDRANYYYTKWSNESISDFTFEDLENEYASKYNPTSNTEKYIIKNNINVVTSTADNYTKFFFSIRYTDENREDAIDKAQILALAVKNELQLKEDSGEYTYFNGLEIDIDNKGVESVLSSVSKTRIVIIAMLLGVVASAIVVYLRTVFDNTIKSKKELEEITDAKLISTLVRQGGNK